MALTPSGRWYRILPLTIALAILVGCGEKPYTGPPAARVATIKEAKKWAADFEADMKDRSSRRDDWIDWERLFGHSTANVPIKKRDRENARRGFMQAARAPTGLLPQVRKQIRDGGRYSLVRVYKSGKEVRALFRLVGADESLNYHDYILTESGDGRIRAEDIHIYIAGESVSETMNRFFLQFAAEMDSSLMTRLSGRQKKLLKHMSKIQQMAASFRAGNARRTLSLYKQLPSELRTMKAVMLYRVMASGRVGDDSLYVDAIRDFRNQYPKDASLNLLLIDYYVLKKDYPAALKSIDALDKQLGGDPFLDSHRAGVHRLAGNESKARELEQRAATANQ